MRIGKLLILATVIVLTGSTLKAQTLKFGHIDVEALVLEMPEYKTIQTTLDSETSKLESQFTSMREELSKLEADYQKNGAALSATAKEAKEKELVDMQEKVQAFYVNSQKSLQQKNQELQAPVWDKINKAIEAVGLENGFLYIFEVKSGLTLYHSNQSIDVISLVKAKLGINNVSK